MKPFLALLASLALATALAGCGEKLTPEEEAARDTVESLYLSVGEAQWNKACKLVTKDYYKGVGNILEVIDSVGAKIAKEQGRRPPQAKQSPRSCPEVFETLIAAQSPITPGSGYPEISFTGYEVSGNRARIEADVSNETYFGDRSGKGSSPRTFVLLRADGQWRVQSVETPAPASEDLEIPSE